MAALSECVADAILAKSRDSEYCMELQLTDVNPARDLTKLRIALIGNQSSALINFRGALIRRLVAKGHQVFALVPDSTPETRAAINSLGATVIQHDLSRSGINPWIDILAGWKLHVQLRHIAPDVVLAYTVKPVIYGILAARFAGVQRRYALIEGLGHAFIHSRGARSRLLQWAVSILYRLSLARATRTLFLNSDDLAEFSERNLIPKGRSRVVGAIGVDLEEWTPTPLVADPITFLFIGRVLYEKGVAEFVAAAKQLRVDYPFARFVILGDVDSNPSSFSREALAALAAEGLIEWPGHAKVKPWISQASVFVLPSYREGFPRATQEAMAMGRPVITTDVPGCRETVVDGDNGFLVPPRDSDALVGAMRKFLVQPELVRSMGARSRHMAELRFDEAQAIDRQLDGMDISR